MTTATGQTFRMRPDRIGELNRHHNPRKGETGERTYSAHWQDFYWQAPETDSVQHQAGLWCAGNMHGSTRLRRTASNAGR